MIKIAFAAITAMVIAMPACAQVVEPTARTPAVHSGASGVVTHQTGSTGAEDSVTYSPTGQPADVISNNAASSGNAGQPERVAPQGSGGGR